MRIIGMTERMREREKDLDRIMSEDMHPKLIFICCLFEMFFLFHICITHCESIGFFFLLYFILRRSWLEATSYMNSFLFNSISMAIRDTRYNVRLFKKDKQLHIFVDVVTVTQSSRSEQTHLSVKKGFSFLFHAVRILMLQ